MAKDCSEAKDCGEAKAGNVCWLSMDDPFELLAKAISPPWESGLQSSVAMQPVRWEEGATSSRDCWHHRVARCCRGDGELLIHHLTHVHAGAESFRAQLSSAARQEEQTAAAEQDTPERASNVGGFHGARDLWTRPSFAACSAPESLRRAVELAAIAEGAALARPPMRLPPDDTPEAWFNHLPPGGWNTLHNHPGRTFSLVYFVADGKGGQCAADDAPHELLGGQLGGRLALLPGVTTISDEQRRDHVVPADGVGDHVGDHVRDQTPEAEQGPDRVKEPVCTEPPLDHLRYLLVDPVPGTCVVFPSFVPHFVIPEGDGRAPLPTPPTGSPDSHGGRTSVACNFSATRDVDLLSHPLGPIDTSTRI